MHHICASRRVLLVTEQTVTKILLPKPYYIFSMLKKQLGNQGGGCLGFSVAFSLPLSQKTPRTG